MSPRPASGWVFVRNEEMSERGCFIAARLDFQLPGLGATLETEKRSLAVLVCDIGGNLEWPVQGHADPQF